MNKKLLLRHSLISVLVLYCTSSFAVRPIDRCEGALGTQASVQNSTLKVGDILDVYKLGFTNGLALGQLRGNGKTLQEAGYGSNGQRTYLSTSFINEAQIVGVFENQLCLVNAADGRVLYVFPNTNLPTDSRNQFGPMIGPNKDLAIFVIDRQIRFYDLAKEKWVKSILITSNFANEITSSVKLSKDGERIFWMGSKGSMKIISTTDDASAYFEANILTEGMLDVKGHRPHVIESENGRYVFFVNYDLGTPSSASSFLYDLKEQKMIAPPKKNSFLSLFRGSSERDQFFAGVTSAVFSGDDRLIVEMGEEGDPVSTGVHYSARHRRELDLKTGQWIALGFPQDSSRFTRIREGLSARLWDIFSLPEVGLRVTELPVFQDGYSVRRAIGSKREGQLPYLVVTDEAGRTIEIDHSSVSLAHFTSNGRVFDSSHYVFKAVYDADVAKEFGFDKGRVPYRTKPEVEMAHFRANKHNQTSWYVFVGSTKKIERIVMDEFDKYAAENPIEARALNLIGITPDFTRLIFVGPSSKWMSFEVSSPTLVLRDQ